MTNEPLIPLLPSTNYFMAMLIFQNIHATDVGMAGILQNVFSKGMYTLKDPENVSKLKTLVNHSALYVGLIVYTAFGAKVNECYVVNLIDFLFSMIFQGFPNT